MNMNMDMDNDQVTTTFTSDPAAVGGGATNAAAAAHDHDHEVIQEVAKEGMSHKAKERRKNRRSQSQVAAKQKKPKPKSISWRGGIILLVMMVAFGSITTLIPRCDALGEGEVPTLALPPYASVSRSLRRKQKDHRSIDNAAPKSPDIVSPLAAVVLPPVFSLAAASNSNRRMQSDESTSSTCLDTPNE